MTAKCTNIMILSTNISKSTEEITEDTLYWCFVKLKRHPTFLQCFQMTLPKATLLAWLQNEI